tara:strand:+ start:535 stop:852 length:318 start_codon:yes stop_codon:yes gene_type:complete
MELFENLKKKCENLSINEETIMIVLKYAMEIVELTSLKGGEQKLKVKELVTKIIEESDINEETKKICIEIINNKTTNTVIDLIVEASKGHVKINLKKKIKKLCCM